MVFGLIPLVVGIPYAVAWILRPTQFLNVTFGYPYAGISLLCFSLSFVLGVIAAFRNYLGFESSLMPEAEHASA